MITIYSSDSTGIRGNCLYPYRHEVMDAAGLREAVKHDYVCAEYKNSYRSGGNFITSNCLGMDCDNDHTDHEHEWITPDDVRRNFPDVPLGDSLQSPSYEAQGSEIRKAAIPLPVRH